MKRLWIFSSVVLLIVASSCSSNSSVAASVSSSASPSSSLSTSSSTLSSSSSSVSESSSSSEEVSSGLLEFIASRASFYNGGMTAEEIGEKAGLSKSAAYTEGNVIRLLRAAFEGYMPPLVGQRKYIGATFYPSKASITTPQVKSAMEWLTQYGLWYDFSDETEVMDEADIKTIFARFYQYFGTNEKDDFNTANNYKFYFYGTGDENVSLNDFYVKSQLVDSDIIDETCVKYARSYSVSDSVYASRYKGALDYMEGEADYSFLNEEGVDDEIKGLSNPTSSESWFQACGNMFKNYGESPFFYLQDMDGYYEDGGTTLLPCLLIKCGSFNLTSLDFDKASNVESKKDTFLSSFLYLGFDQTEASAMADLCIEFGKKQKEYYTTTFKDDIPTSSSLAACVYDNSTSKDVFQTAGLSYSLQSVGEAAGFNLEDLKQLRTSNLALFLATGKALDEASLATKAAIATLEFYNTNKVSLSYTAGEEWGYSNIESLIARPLATDYSSTQLYLDNRTLTSEVIDNLKSSFSSRSRASSWLSENGADAVDAKLGNLKSYLYSSDEERAIFDYTPYTSTWTNKLSKELGSYNYNTWRISLDSIIGGASIIEAYDKCIDPFTANAFYSSYDNDITITLGYLFSLGGDVTDLSTEELYSTLGFVCGHEITHGFDNTGSFYDKDGKYVEASIFSEDDKAAFLAKKVETESLYEGKEYIPLGYFSIKGDVVVGEAMADIGGLALTEEMASKVDEFDYEAFYRYCSYHMAEKCSLMEMALLHSDVHPFGKARANTLLSNSSKFASTFEIQEGDGMYLSENERVTIW